MPKNYFMKLKISILFVIFISIIYGQTLPSIQTDRPDQTECPFIVPKNYLQFENGFVYQRNNDNFLEIVTPSILSKFGINDYFELRLITEFVTNQENDSKTAGIVPVLIGFKSRLFSEKGLLPTTSFIAHLSIPKLANNYFKKDFYTPEFRFAMQHTINSNQTLSYNLGAEWNGVSPEPIFIYTLTSGYSFSEKISGYLEFFGFVPQIQTPDHRFDGGICYLFNQNHQLDVSAGFGFGYSELKYYFGLGYSFRFET